MESNEIVWKDSYNTGIEEIDEQHRILVNTINEANIKLQENDSIKTLESITKDLLSYVLYHFETEEDMMAKHDYKSYNNEDYEKHMKQHRDFSAKVVSIRDMLSKGKPIEKEELIEFLTNWLVNHINNTDKKLASFLKVV
ncbi:MAG: bacteriohemerythrin [Campylobacterota bacterium]